MSKGGEVSPPFPLRVIGWGAGESGSVFSNKRKNRGGILGGGVRGTGPIIISTGRGLRGTDRAV